MASLDQEPPASGDEPRTLTGRGGRRLLLTSNTEAIRVLEREFFDGRKSRSIFCRTRRSANNSRLHFVLPVLITAPIRNWYFQRPGSTIAISYLTPLCIIGDSRDQHEEAAERHGGKPGKQ
jgi:hypothetical protein